MDQFTPQQLAAARWKCRRSFYYFVRWMFYRRKRQKWQHNHHLETIAHEFQKVYLGRTKYLLVNVPPRYGKSELLNHFTAWTLGLAPDSEYIYTSYSGRLATWNNYNCRSIVSHPEYQAIFPAVRLMQDSQAKDEWRTTEGGVVYAAGSGGTITGYGAGKQRDQWGGCISIDDPLKPDEASSQLIRSNWLDFYQNTLESRKNGPNTPTIMIMQRLHVDDPSGWVLKGGTGHQWHHVKMSAIQPDGTALWPAKHTLEDLARLEAASKYTFSGQYRQEPTLLGGGLIRGEWFKRYRVLPHLRYRKIYADTAQKTKEWNDFSVFACWGYGFDGQAYLIDLLRGKWEAWELESRAVDFWNKHVEEQTGLGALRAMIVEDKSSGTGLIQDIRKKTAIPIKGLPRDKDKLTRLMDVQGYIEAGKCVLPESAPWVSDFIGECESITPNDTHAYDDQVDTLIDAIQDMLAPASNLSMWARLGER